MKYLKQTGFLLKSSLKKYQKDDPIVLASTTAYFTLFAVAPIIIIIVSLIGYLVGEETIREKLFNEIRTLFGEDQAKYIQNLVQNFQQPNKNLMGTIIGIAIFIITSTTFFVVLQKNLNMIWRVKPKPKYNWLKALKDRLLSFGLIISMGFIMLVALLVDAVITYLKDFINSYLPDFTAFLIKGINSFVSFAVITLIFAILYRFLPDARIKWKTTWIGALITAGLFTLGKYLIGLLIGNTNIGVMYGTAGSLVVILLWVFYSSLIFFLGAEITQQYAEHFGEGIRPKDYAVRIEIKEGIEKE